MAVSSFLSSFFPVVHNDGPEQLPVNEEEREPNEGSQNKDVAVPAEEEGATEEEEEEEPEDVHPAVKEECQNSQKCAPLTKHFQHCHEKVESGKGFKHEDCVEELMMHCVDNCAAPKLFSKLQ